MPNSDISLVLLTKPILCCRVLLVQPAPLAPRANRVHVETQEISEPLDNLVRRETG